MWSAFLDIYQGEATSELIDWMQFPRKGINFTNSVRVKFVLA